MQQMYTQTFMHYRFGDSKADAEICEKENDTYLYADCLSPLNSNYSNLWECFGYTN